MTFTKYQWKLCCVALFAVPSMLWPNPAVAFTMGLISIFLYFAVLENQEDE